jgi:hypothetical protein
MPGLSRVYVAVSVPQERDEGVALQFDEAVIAHSVGKGPGIVLADLLQIEGLEVAIT